MTSKFKIVLDAWLPSSFKLPELTEVTSSNLAAIGYNEDTGDFIAHFRSGDVYRYEKVEKKAAAQVFAAHEQGASVGKTFIAVVRSGGYDYKHVGIAVAADTIVEEDTTAVDVEPKPAKKARAKKS